MVLVNVVGSDVSKFFAYDGEYTIQKQSDGKYLLTHQEIKNATIEIDTNKNLVYLHPRIDIDGEIYKLSIIAKNPQTLLAWQIECSRNCKQKTTTWFSTITDSY